MSDTADDRSGGVPVALIVRFVWGVALLCVPGPILRLLGGADEGRAPRRVIRVLGARHVIEALAERRYGAPAQKVGVAVDLLHAATDVGFAAADPRWRRAALTDSVIATGFAVAGGRRRPQAGRPLSGLVSSVLMAGRMSSGRMSSGSG